MWGDGSASPGLLPKCHAASPPAAQPQNLGAAKRKGTAFPHIKRQSREENTISKMCRN